MQVKILTIAGVACRMISLDGVNWRKDTCAPIVTAELMPPIAVPSHGVPRLEGKGRKVFCRMRGGRLGTVRMKPVSRADSLRKHYLKLDHAAAMRSLYKNGQGVPPLFGPLFNSPEMCEPTRRSHGKFHEEWNVTLRSF